MHVSAHASFLPLGIACICSWHGRKSICALHVSQEDVGQLFVSKYLTEILLCTLMCPVHPMPLRPVLLACKEEMVNRFGLVSVALGAFIGFRQLPFV